MSSRRWPVHPRPLPDESLRSWMTRTARANASTLSALLAAEHGRNAPRTHFDTHDDPDLRAMLAERTGIAGGADAVKALTLLGDIRTMGDHAADRWVLAVEKRVDRPKHRHCPTCLANDPEPYFRRAWRWSWVRWCPVDGTRLRDACGTCGEMVDVTRVGWKKPLATCWRCDSSLACANDGATEAPSFVTARVAEALADLAAPDPSSTDRWGAVWCLTKWVESLGARRWADVRSGLGAAGDELPTTWSVDESDREAWSFAVAWHLATDGAAALPALARRFQSTFNRATNYRCPASLLPLRRMLTTPRGITAERVTAAVESLLAARRPVHCAAVAAELQVDPHAITDRPEFRAIVDRGAEEVAARWREGMRVRLSTARDQLVVRGARLSRAELAAEANVSLEKIARWERETGETFAVSPVETYEVRVKEAVAALTARGERVTTVGVCRVLGMDRNLIEKRPALKAIVRTLTDDPKG